MGKQKIIPQMRFPEFEGEWVNKKLGQIYKFKITNSLSRADLNYENGSVKNIHYGDIHTQYATLFDITKESVPFINHELNITKYSDENYCQEGDLIFADASEDYNDIGKCIEIVNLNNEKVQSGLHTLLARPEKSIMTIGFAGYLMKSGNVKLQIQREAQGTKVLSITSGRLSKIELIFPALPEQQKIASFFTAIDQKISQLKRKKTLLEEYKKGVMQKIFSQEIRFRDDNGQEFPKWEKKKLGDVAEIKYGKDQKGIACENGKYPILGTGGIMGRTNEFLSDKPSVLIGRKGTIDKPLFIDTPFWTVDTLFYTIVISNVNPKWLYYNLTKVNWYKYNEASGVPSLSTSTINKITINLPSLGEQTKIANFLSAIDDKINHTQKQVEKAEVWKKGLMQQMFV